MLRVIGQQRPAQAEQLKHAVIGDAVEDVGVAALARDEPAPAQARQVVGDLRLGLAEALYEVADRQLAVLVEQLQRAHPRRIRQHLEVLGDEVGLGGSVRQQKRHIERGARHAGTVSPWSDSVLLTVKIEVWYFDGCPSHEAFLPRLRELLAQAGVDVPIAERRVESDADAQRERFLGSPTLRVDGVDVDPDAGERSDYGLQCRLYRTDEGLSGAPRDEWVLGAVQRADRAAGPS